MSTAVETEEGLQRDVIVEVIPDWAAGYALDVPCIVQDCTTEVAWWGNQHGCYTGHMCDPHTMDYIARLRHDLLAFGNLKCRRCKGHFPTIEAFVKLVRI